MSELIVGAARANITPPVGMLMSGYAARKTPAIGVHDELNAVALYLSDGETEAGLITADLIGIDVQGTALIREACESICGVPAGNILVACSHTHGGPQTSLRRREDEDELKRAYSTVLIHKMAGALSEAKLRAKPVRVGYGRQDCLIALNRRERRPDGKTVLGVNPSGPIAPYTDVIRFDEIESGKTMALLFSYAAHGTTLGGDNLYYTADYPGVAKRFIESNLSNALALFVAACSADVNPYPRGNFELCERHGIRLGCAVLQAAMGIDEMEEDLRIAVARYEFALNLGEKPSLEEAREKLKRIRARAEEEIARARKAAGGKPVDEKDALSWFTARMLRGTEELVRDLEAGKADFTIPVETQAIAIGDYAIVGLPGEIFVNIGLKVAEESPFKVTIPVSHANGAIGYVPTADQVPLGGYEVEMARASRYGIFIAPESDRVMIEGALEALRRCYREVSHGQA